MAAETEPKSLPGHDALSSTMIMDLGSSHCRRINEGTLHTAHQLMVSERRAIPRSMSLVTTNLHLGDQTILTRWWRYVEGYAITKRHVAFTAVADFTAIYPDNEIE
ncbi:hypothetical protein F2P81_000991 [Scophthalmus maximus]|uniref:Uncharacterized protein n=1 Tax=Scophthalmus maximus TaxID=52904 RepID=A0A6A4TSP1_SCOMX|nr:hypothetical protein F2P81_000991 [Scophthalmus maximus]